VKTERPDAVIVATGAKPWLPSLEGVEKAHVLGAEDVLSGSADVGRRVAVVGGGGIGAEVADFLSENGKEVTLIEMMEQIGLGPERFCANLPGSPAETERGPDLDFH